MKRRPALAFVLMASMLLLVLVSSESLFTPRVESRVTSPSGQLTEEERVTYQRRIEEVYWRHRIAPTAGSAKPAFDMVMPMEAIRQRVEDSLQLSQALAATWNTEVTPETLQAELDRIARQTRQPDVLRELFATLDNDAHLIAECLVRPILVERLARSHFENRAPQDETFDEWWASEKNRFSTDLVEQDFSYRLPEINAAAASASDDTWRSLPTLPTGYYEHTAVWTGTEVLVWGGSTIGSFSSRTNAGSRYNPATDSWRPITGSNAPQGRRGHTAIWTGTEMIIWGGCGTATQFCGLLDGGRYNPATDSWTLMTINNAPAPRLYHTAVWTGDRMIVYGGCTPNADFTVCTDLRSGGMYFPATDTWVATAQGTFTRRRHTAVWTGTEMLVWGGFSSTGERFNPQSNSWTLMSAVDAPSPREYHTAVWTGSLLIVWGGVTSSQTTLDTGGRYDPSTDTWTPTSQANAPSPRYQHTAVWTGTEMIVWGGKPEVPGEAGLNTGARYNPVSDTWIATNTANAPLPRYGHKAVWTGTEMIVWGGAGDVRFLTGGRYNPTTDSWAAVSTNGGPPNTDAKTVWTGTEMIVWGGAFTDLGFKYTLATDTWSAISTDPIASQIDRGFTLLWTGSEMIVWGGQTGSTVYNVGARYNPATNLWALTSTTNAPSPRSYHSAVWSGTEMIVWGGNDGTMLNTGGRYNPQTDTWTQTSTTNAPDGRYDHRAVFLQGKMVVWGGLNSSGTLNTGGRYDPANNTWQATSLVNAPSPRTNHTIVATGTEMIVWGGSEFQFGNFLNTGGRYNPVTDVWIPTSTVNAPAPRILHTAVWTGREMIVWGGNTSSALGQLGSNTGGRYNPTSDSWRATTTQGAGVERSSHNAVWTGQSMIIWGGNARAATPRAGYEYFAATAATVYDFDGDGLADIAVYRPETGGWYVVNSSNGAVTTRSWGMSTDKLVPADYDGDGRMDIAVFRQEEGNWYIIKSSDGAGFIRNWGGTEDVPVSGDYDGDGRADVAIYRPGEGNWYIVNSSTGAVTLMQWGIATDTPVPADYDGDGRTDLAVFRPDEGHWYIITSHNAAGLVISWGASTDRLVPADYDGDGRTDKAVFRPDDGHWYIINSSDNSVTVRGWGGSSDVPVPRDYDGDGRADIAVFRPSEGNWYIIQSRTGASITRHLGESTDVPVTFGDVP